VVGGCAIALEQRVLGFGIESGGRFVQDEEQRMIAHETPRSASFCIGRN